MAREPQGKERGRLSQHSRRRCFLGRGLGDAPRFSEGKRPAGDLASALKHGPRRKINKSRSYCSCKIRQAFVPPPFPKYIREPLSLEAFIYIKQREKQAHVCLSHTLHHPPPIPAETTPRNTNKDRAQSKWTVAAQRTHKYTCSEAIESGKGKGMRRHSETPGGVGGREKKKNYARRRRQTFE